MANNYSIDDCSGKVKAFCEEHQADPMTRELPALPDAERIDLFTLSDADIFVVCRAFSFSKDLEASQYSQVQGTRERVPQTQEQVVTPV